VESKKTKQRFALVVKEEVTPAEIPEKMRREDETIVGRV